MNGYWENGAFVLASTAQDRIARLETQLAELRDETGREKALLALYQRAFKEVQNFITLACNGRSDKSNAKYCWTLMKNAHDAAKNSYDISTYLQHLPSCSALIPTISDKRGYSRSCNCGFRERTGVKE